MKRSANGSIKTTPSFIMNVEDIGRSVCLIKLPNGRIGTGFCVEVFDILCLLTANHAINTDQIARETICFFNKLTSTMSGTNEVRLNPTFFYTDKKLDFTVVAFLAQDVKDNVDALPTNIEHKPEVGKSIIGIWGHPDYPDDENAKSKYPPLSISVGFITELASNGNNIYYNCETCKGNSGSPVIDTTNGTVIAMHHSTDKQKKNGGTTIGKIIEKIKDNFKQPKIVQNQLGISYLKRNENYADKVDQEEAFRLFKLAAAANDADDNGLAEGQANLAKCYEEGIGVVRKSKNNKAEAKYYYRLAAEQGLDSAQQWCAANRIVIEIAAAAEQEGNRPAARRRSGIISEEGRIGVMKKGDVELKKTDDSKPSTSSSSPAKSFAPTKSNSIATSFSAAYSQPTTSGDGPSQQQATSSTSSSRPAKSFAPTKSNPIATSLISRYHLLFGVPSTFSTISSRRFTCSVTAAERPGPGPSDKETSEPTVKKSGRSSSSQQQPSMKSSSSLNRSEVDTLALKMVAGVRRDTVLNTTMEKSMESNGSMVENSASLIGFYQAYENVLALIKCTKPEMVTIKKTLIEECGWKVIYSTVQRTSYILAPWIQNQDNFAVWRAGNTADFQHLSDYFLDNKNDEIKLLEALQSEYFQKKCGDFIVAQNPGKESAPMELSPLELRSNILPQRPARDPSDRLVPAKPAPTPQIATNDSEFHLSEDDCVFGDDDDLLAGEAEPPSSDNSSTTTLYNLLCSSSVKFAAVYDKLKSMEPPWTCVYSDPERHSHLEVNIEGSSRIYLRPLKKVSDVNMIFNEDYFYSEAALIRYLKLNYGIETLHIDASEDDEGKFQERQPAWQSSQANEADSIASSNDKGWCQRKVHTSISSDSFAAAPKRSVQKQPTKSKLTTLKTRKQCLSDIFDEDSEDELQQSRDVSQRSRYGVDTDEYLLVQYLKETPPSFGKIRFALNRLGWRLVYERSSKEEKKISKDLHVSYFLAPSAITKEGGFENILENKKNYVIINRSVLGEGIDYFREDEKEKLYGFLRENGFADTKIKKTRDGKKSPRRSTGSVSAAERPGSSDEGNEQPVKKGLRSSSQPPQSSTMTSSSNPFEVDTIKHRLAQSLDESPPTFGKIMNALDALGWRIVHERTLGVLKKVNTNSYSTYFLAPSADTKKGGYKQTADNKNKIVYVTINRDVLEEDVDFFNFHKKKALYDFLKINYSKSPLSITARTSPEHLPTNTFGLREAITALIATDKVGKDEIAILHRLMNPELQHSVIWEHLQSLGWFHVKESVGGTTYYVAPWAQDFDHSLTHFRGGLAVLDREKLSENDDFFNSDKVEELYRYLVEFKFSRRLDDTASSSKVTTAQVAVSPNRYLKEETRQHVEHLGVILTDGKPEYDIAVELSKVKPSPGKVWNRLESLGWYIIYESCDDKYYIAPWVHDEILHREKVYKVIDKSKLVENVDFFDASNLPQLYDYLRKNDFSRKVHSSEPTLFSREIAHLESLGLRARTAVAKQSQSQSQSHPPGRNSEKLPTKTTKADIQPSPFVSTQSDDYNDRQAELAVRVNLKRNRNVANHDISSGDDRRRSDTNSKSVVEIPPSPIVVVPKKALTLRESIELVYPSFLSDFIRSDDEYCCSSIQTPDRPLANTVIRRDAEKEELSSIIKAALVKAEVK